MARLCAGSARRRGLVGAVVAILVTLGAGAAPLPARSAMPAPGLSRASACYDVAVLGARGSGERSVAGTRGMGATVFNAYREYAVRVPLRTVGAAGVVYPAQGVEVLGVAPKMYFQGLDQGVDDVVSDLRAFAARCPDQRFVLIGYSQGAMVVHRAVWRLADRGFDLGRIDGVIAIADGDRLVRKGVVQYGSAKNGKGISWVLPRLAGAEYKPRKGVPGGLRGRFHSVCLDHDIVCDANLAHLSAVGVAGVLNHGKYAPRKPAAKYVRAAAAAVARYSLSVPQPPPTTPPGSSGETEREQLIAAVNVARTQSRWCGQVQYPAVGPLQRIPALDTAAQRFAERMATEGFFDHVAPDGTTPTDRAAAEGYAGPLGENLAAGMARADYAVDSWLASPMHCRVLMTATSVTGAGYVEATGAPYRHYWVFLGDCSCGGSTAPQRRGR